jgi:hypothetical protein
MSVRRPKVFLVATMLFLLLSVGFGRLARAVPVRDRAVQEQPNLVGTYALYRKGDATRTPIAMMAITDQKGGRFVVGIAQLTGQPAVDWEGRGTLEGSQGSYDWVFQDGKSGRTTFTLDADGNLHGQVRGSGIDWDYVANRLPGLTPRPEQ